MTKPRHKQIHIYLIFFAILLLVGLYRYMSIKEPTQKANGERPPSLSLTPVAPHTLIKSIFIPYWALQQDNMQNEYDEFYYFGVVSTQEGEIEDEQGSKNIDGLDNLDNKKTTLVVRLTNEQIVESLLDSKTRQIKLSKSLKDIVNRSQMKGVALDIEIPFSLNSNKPIQINNFVQQICTELHADYKTCDLIVYGDMFFRSRPFDMKSLGGLVDRVLIMAYDFHKSMGEPGPNFPLIKSTNYGYDFKQMITDFSRVVSKSKLVVIFGMYGYDWTLNDQGAPLKSAVPVSVNSIKSQVESLKNNAKSELSVTQNESLETRIAYIDDEGRKHIIWYEDEESAQKKIDYLKTQGIMQISYWANGYF